MKNFEFIIHEIEKGVVVERYPIIQKATSEKWAKTLAWRKLKENFPYQNIKISNTRKLIKVYYEGGKLYRRYKLKYKLSPTDQVFTSPTPFWLRQKNYGLGFGAMAGIWIGAMFAKKKNGHLF